MFTRRNLVLAAFAVLTLSQTACCGRPNCCHRIRQCKGCCSPSFDAPAAAPMPVAGPAPGCATCFSPPAGPPVGPPVGPAGVPVYSAPLPTPNALTPPSVFQSSEGPKPMPTLGGGK